ncbi:MAG: HAD hydrolase family protein [Burkholderiales bacterium]|nr:MAG: HAD hydrolase family protein [Burkholderiales bacterium]
MQANDTSEALVRARRLRAFAFDVDGVLTDGTLYFGVSGDAMKGFSVHDGFGLNLLRRAGLRLAIVTGRNAPIVQARAAELGIDCVLQGIQDKASGLAAVAQRFDQPLECIGYMGDDWPDLGALQRAGFAATVASAPAALRGAADWVATREPGHGAVRELCAWLLLARGELESLLAPYRGDAGVTPPRSAG